MEKVLFMVEQESSDPAQDESVREWLDNVHLPGVLTVHGVVRATLYVNRGPMLDALNLIGHRQDPGLNPPGKGWSEGQGKYVAIYEIETEDIKKTFEAIMRWVQEMQRTHKDFRHPFLKVVSRYVWEQVSPSKEAPSR
ncbi:MAG: hypothetical protein HYX92_06130 [Chloroflexi bacterium]|nr:hypothetical protein [Chloroflexota bacterium]